MLAFLFIQCTDDSSISEPGTPKSSNVEFSNKQETAANLAKVLAYELQKNDKTRQEVFAKISTQIDGDFEVPLDYLNQNTLGKIEKTAKELKSVSSLSKSTVNFATVKEIKFNELENNFDTLQIAMPYAARWTDEEIKAEGGLIVAYYPFGVQDTEIKELVGYNKNGEKVIITEKTAPNIPYVILSGNERKMMLDKVSSTLKTEFKNFTGNNNVQWKNRKLDELKSIVPSGITDKILMPVVGGEGSGGGGSGGSGTGGGGGGGNPNDPHTWSASQYLRITGIEVINISDYEPYWTRGEPEFEIQVAFINIATPYTVLASSSGELAGIYNGTTPWHLWGPQHHYRGGWVYGNYHQFIKREYLQPGALLNISAVEVDGGSSQIKFNISISGYGIGIQYKDQDDKFGNVYFDQYSNYPQIFYAGNFHVKLNTL